MDPRERFTDTVTDYDRWRPDYPSALVRWLRAQAPGLRAVDLGSGTGIFSRQLAAEGFDVIGVEPNAAMRARAEALGGPRYVTGQAEDTELPSGSAELVVAAQAFHWFDLERALAEIDRILVPGGLAAAIWNVRVDEGFGAAYEALLCAWSSTYADVPTPERTLRRLRAVRSSTMSATFDHQQVLDRPGVLGRAASASYVVHGVADRAGFDAALRAAFDAHQVEGKVTLRYQTALRAWRRS